MFSESIFRRIRRHESEVGTEALGTHEKKVIDVTVGTVTMIELRHWVMSQDPLKMLFSLIGGQEGSWEEGWKSVLTVV